MRLSRCVLRLSRVRRDTRDVSDALLRQVRSLAWSNRGCSEHTQRIRCEDSDLLCFGNIVLTIEHTLHRSHLGDPSPKIDCFFFPQAQFGRFKKMRQNQLGLFKWYVGLILWKMTNLDITSFRAFTAGVTVHQRAHQGAGPPGDRELRWAECVWSKEAKG